MAILTDERQSPWWRRWFWGGLYIMQQPPRPPLAAYVGLWQPDRA